MITKPWSPYFGPQEGEPKCDGNEKGTHWYCLCGVRNKISTERCRGPGCGRHKSENVGLAYVDGPGQDEDSDDNPLHIEE